MPWLNQNSAGSCHNRGCVVSGPPWGEGGEGWGGVGSYSESVYATAV